MNVTRQNATWPGGVQFPVSDMTQREKDADLLGLFHHSLSFDELSHVLDISKAKLFLSITKCAGV